MVLGDCSGNDLSKTLLERNNEGVKEIVGKNDTLRHTKPAYCSRRGYYGCNLWHVYSHKIGRRVNLYSDLEYYHWITVEATPEIIAFCEQPIRVISHVDGKDAVSLIDMWVKYKTGREEYREVKYESELKKIMERPRLKKQLETQQSWCERHGLTHRIITDAEIYENDLWLRNWRLILSLISNNTKKESIANIQKSIIGIVNNEKTTVVSG